ncbi:neugrin [Hemicordylus capensis]|uniref:neugrin n=1 Tax=Hemicordylus capensis TaxID=884348 RepID=UPI002302F7AC|nr:neugrin [Hemicordylus capensis]
MARTGRLLLLLLAPGLLRRAPARLAARWAGGAPEQPQEPEQVVAELERKLQRQQKAVRWRKLRRQMEPRGAPERTLTRQAMEQIRYLRQEFPEDWPVPRLAQGFQVEPDIIHRVLRSRFSPSVERSRKQDGRVLARQSSLRSSSGGQPTGPGPGQQALLTRESTFRLLPAISGRGSLPQRAAPLDSSAPKAVERKRADRGQDAPQPESSSRVEEEEEEEEEWQGQILSEGLLAELAAEGWESSLRVVQRGREFLDGDGNLLYRVPVPQQDKENQ